MIIELLDQCVRERGGGDMAPFLTAAKSDDRPFIRTRVGLQAEPYWSQEAALVQPSRMIRRILNQPARLIPRARKSIAKALAWMVLGKAGSTALDVGLFRGCGEVHMWMYDTYSLGELLSAVGFDSVVSCEPHASRIRDFSKFELDVADGAVIKPNSVFMEGIRPFPQ